jgi:hypothetical protein
MVPHAGGRTQIEGRGRLGNGIVGSGRLGKGLASNEDGLGLGVKPDPAGEDVGDAIGVGVGDSTVWMGEELVGDDGVAS